METKMETTSDYPWTARGDDYEITWLSNLYAEGVCFDVPFNARLLGERFRASFYFDGPAAEPTTITIPQETHVHLAYLTARLIRANRDLPGLPNP